MTLNGKFREGWEFDKSVSYLQVYLSVELAKQFPDPGYLRSKDGVVIYW